MPKHRPAPPRSAPTRLGRGLGNLIPVPIAPVVREVVAREPVGGAKTSRNQHETGDAQSRRGLPAHSEPAPTEPSFARSERIEFIPIRALKPGRYQPRSVMSEESLRELAASIASSGLMQPVVVRPAADAPGMFEIVAGERRWRALQQLGHEHAPAIIRTVDDQGAAELALVENLQREDLNAMDRAAALRRLVDEFGLTHQELGSRVGIDRATVSNLLRLNDLDQRCTELVRSGELSAGHAKALLAVTDVSARVKLAELASRGQWSVRHLESKVAEGSVPRGTRAKVAAPANAHIARIERDLQAHLGTRVAIKLGRKKGVGELRIHFFSLDEFDGLMQRIGYREGETRIVV